MAQVLLKNVEKTFSNGNTVIEKFNLQIENGEFIALVGPSGCAKSTLLRMIAGLENIDNGEIFIDGKEINNLQPKEREISMVFQNYALYPHMNVHDNLSFVMKLQKISNDIINKKVEIIAKKMGLNALLGMKPSKMSGGERQRVSVGRALAKEPKLYLFDEPLSNLDAKLRAQLRVEFSKLHKELKKNSSNSTVIYVTHDQIEAMTMADRICVMNYGKIMQIDTPSNLYNKPQNKFVASFIGTPQMNIFKGYICEKNNSFFIDIEDLKIKLPISKIKKLKNILTKKVWFGIRPENIRIKNELMDFGLSLKGRIYYIEHLGNNILVYFYVGNKSFIGKFDANDCESLKKNIEYEFFLDLNEIHLFDFFTEENISL